MYTLPTTAATAAAAAAAKVAQALAEERVTAAAINKVCIRPSSGYCKLVSVKKQGQLKVVVRKW